MRFLINTIKLLFVIMPLLILATCGLLEPPVTQGGLVIVLEKSENLAKPVQPEEDLSSVQCIVKKGSSTIYDQNLSKSGGYYEAEITDLEPASNYSVLLYVSGGTQSVPPRGS